MSVRASLFPAETWAAKRQGRVKKKILYRAVDETLANVDVCLGRCSSRRHCGCTYVCYLLFPITIRSLAGEPNGVTGSVPHQGIRNIDNTASEPYIEDHILPIHTGTLQRHHILHLRVEPHALGLSAGTAQVLLHPQQLHVETTDYGGLLPTPAMKRIRPQSIYSTPRSREATTATRQGSKQYNKMNMFRKR